MRHAILVLAVALLGGDLLLADDGQPKPMAKETKQAEPEVKDARQVEDANLKEDRKLMEGKFERLLDPPAAYGIVKAVKEIKGNKELVTYYDKNGKLVYSNTADIKLIKSGPVRVFQWSNGRIVDGIGKGQKYPVVERPEETSYIYRVDKSGFYELWGFLPGQDTREPLLLFWARVEEQK
jgi:hypothetical protein